MPRFSIKRKKREPELEPEPEPETQPNQDESMEFYDEEYESTSEDDYEDEEDEEDDVASVVTKTAQLKLEPTGGPKLEPPSQRGGARFAQPVTKTDKFRNSWGYSGMNRQPTFGQPRSSLRQIPQKRIHPRRGLQYTSIYGPNSDGMDTQARARLLYARAFG